MADGPLGSRYREADGCSVADLVEKMHNLNSSLQITLRTATSIGTWESGERNH